MDRNDVLFKSKDGRWHLILLLKDQKVFYLMIFFKII